MEAEQEEALSDRSESSEEEAGAVGPVDRTTTLPPWLDEDPSAEGTEGRSILVSWL